MGQISNVVILFNPEKLTELRSALKEVGLSGMTVTRVDGNGLQGGTVRYYSDDKVEVDLLPKIKVEVIVPNDKVEEVIAVSKKVLKTSETGAGKIFVYDVSRVIRISTDDEGLDALNS
jgi:nitrogen regulatory protein PII